MRRKLLEVQNDIKETLTAIADVVNYDDAIQALCLTERRQRIAGATAKPGSPAAAAATPVPARTKEKPRTPHMRMASSILEVGIWGCSCLLRACCVHDC